MNRSFDHEKLDVYQVSIQFVAWAGELIDGALAKRRLSAVKHLDEASTSISLNIAEGNGKRSLKDRCRFFDISKGSALECSACFDVLVARRVLDVKQVEAGKELLVRIVEMLSKLIKKLLGREAMQQPPQR